MTANNIQTVSHLIFLQTRETWSLRFRQFLQVIFIELTAHYQVIGYQLIIFVQYLKRVTMHSNTSIDIRGLGVYPFTGLDY